MTTTTPASKQFHHADADRLTDQLVVGGDLDTTQPALAVRQLTELTDAGVTHIVDARVEWDDAPFVARVAPAVNYLHAGIDDAGQSIPVAWFDTITDWALAALENPRHTVLVHCHMGINRGPSAAFAILLAQGWSVRDALDRLHAARPFAYIAYAEDALRWHHHRNRLPLPLQLEDQEALRTWREAHEKAIDQAIRALRIDAQPIPLETLDDAWPDTDTDDVDVPANTWLFQVSRAEARDCYRDWNNDADWLFTPAADRHTEEIRSGDVAILWVMGPGETAGVIGAGLVEETGFLLEHHRTYQDPTSPTRLRPSVSIDWHFLADHVLVTRKELTALGGFSPDTFELFKMANRANAFAVDAGQAETILNLAQLHSVPA